MWHVNDNKMAQKNRIKMNGTHKQKPYTIQYLGNRSQKRENVATVVRFGDEKFHYSPERST